MKAIASYAMRGRPQAALLSSLFAILAMILPPLSYISGAIVALTTLRRGVGEGALIAGIATGALAIMSLISTGNMVVAMVFAMMVWLPVWILSVVLRQTISLPLTLAVAAMQVVVVMVIFHMAVGDTVAWWSALFDKAFADALGQPGMAEMATMLENAPQMMTGIMSTAFFVSMALSLLLARWWQAALYNPGGFRDEFHQIRLDRRVAIAGSAILVLALVSATPGSIITDLAVIVGVYASVFGVALIHHWVAGTEASKAWLILLYLLLAFIAPQILVVLAIIGFADAWFNIRRFYEKTAD